MKWIEVRSRAASLPGLAPLHCGFLARDWRRTAGLIKFDIADPLMFAIVRENHLSRLTLVYL